MKCGVQSMRGRVPCRMNEQSDASVSIAKSVALILPIHSSRFAFLSKLHRLTHSTIQNNTIMLEAPIATPSYITIPAAEEQETKSVALPSCLKSWGSTRRSHASHRGCLVRFNEKLSVVHEAPIELINCVSDLAERRSIWYNGNDIRRMKQACVAVIARIDAQQPVPRAIEEDWQTGSTSTRGLEFGTQTGKQRKRATKQFHRLILQEQARVWHQHSDPEEEQQGATALLATKAQEASAASVQLALEMAIQDAAFVCRYVENVPRVITAPQRSSPAVVMLLRRIWKAARRQGHPQHHQQRRSSLLQRYRNKTTISSDTRPRCDTESTTTIVVATP